jgi:hypothetical protein
MSAMGGKPTLRRLTQDMIRSAEEFRRLRSSEKPEDYGRAANEPADEAVWLEVIQSYPEMRFWVAQNKTVPLEILRMLAKDDDVRVRSMVASKRKLDMALFNDLARDPDESVRHSIACNGKAPAEVLRCLSRDEHRFVAEAATQRL